ncbi:hypothetical protein Plano_0530 [Planococcus sp. PAMC 21323]|uniref:hypothetical protein n=1 Tax=Planococcus sp. PAMC 21323 TaxID=1526927 RepID=UPI000571195B|nr:hypothetical protein [Planococcus sp. PAMC 21323]AIY04495.1 hypothetical protein Plano_0530 [Planococcus sp. PAMC 21323]
MQSYTFLFFVVGLVVLVTMIAPYFNWWVKSIIVIYYGSLSFIFINKHTSINRTYKDITPVPAAYWEENSQWVWTISNLIFWPFGIMLLYIFFRLFQRAEILSAKVFIAIGLLLAVMLILFLNFVFNFEYGYLP